jgi:hypothetical protein
MTVVHHASHLELKKGQEPVFLKTTVYATFCVNVPSGTVKGMHHFPMKGLAKVFRK